MSLFGSLALARSALAATSTAIQTAGHNIANADSEGYARQRVRLVASEPDDLGFVRVGTGVEVDRIERLVDQQIETMLRDARSRLGDLSTRERILGRVEAAFNALSGGGLEDALGRFFSAVEDLATRPSDYATRVAFLGAARALGEGFQFTREKLDELRGDINTEILAAVREVNRLASEIADLNGRIVALEGGGTRPGAANDLRDERDRRVQELGRILSIRATETSTGYLQVTAGSDFLVFGPEARPLETTDTLEDGVVISTIRFADDGKLLTIQGGELKGLVDGRDEYVIRFRDDLDTLAGTFLGEVNRIHSQGEGLERFTSLTGTYRATSPTVALNAAGLGLEPVNGSFDVRVKNENTGVVNTYNIEVDLDGIGSDMTLEGLAASINAAVGADHPEVTASVTNDFRLEIRSGSSSVTFGFANDTSGALAALGLNVLFTGTGAKDIALSGEVMDNPDLLATGQGEGPGDNRNILAIAELRERKVLDVNAATIEEYYQGMIGSLGVERAEAMDLVETGEAVESELEAQREALSGVSIDEEVIHLLKLQRAFQGAARLLAIVDGLLESLMRVV